MKKLTEFLNEGAFDYDKKQLASFVDSFADEQSNWGTSEMDRDDVDFGAEIVTDGDKFLVAAIIKFVKGVKDKKGAKEWLVDAVMASPGNPSKQKDFLTRLRKTI